MALVSELIRRRKENFRRQQTPDLQRMAEQNAREQDAIRRQEESRRNAELAIETQQAAVVQRPPQVVRSPEQPKNKLVKFGQGIAAAMNKAAQEGKKKKKFYEP